MAKQRQPSNGSPAPRVAVVGGGIAGLTAALRLSQRGYRVTVYEKEERLGGNLSSEYINGVYHDVYPHMFCDWYANFWEICDELHIDPGTHFEPRAGFKILREGTNDYVELKNPTTFGSIWSNLRSGVLSVPEMFIFGFSLLDVACKQFDSSKPLLGSDVSLSGLLYSRPYATEECAELQNLILMVIWSIHADVTSAKSYKLFTKHTISFPRYTPFAWLLKGNLQENLIGPLEQELEKHGCTIRKGTNAGGEVESVQVADHRVEIRVKGEHRRHLYDYVVLAVPARALAKLIATGTRGCRIVDKLPFLSQLASLRGAQIPVVDLYFNKKLPGVPKDHVGLSRSDCDLTFLDISQLWTADPNMKDRTALILAASDFFALPWEATEEDAFLMIQKLQKYLPVFNPGSRWGDPNSDICWEKSWFHSNETNKLSINEIGSWDWRPRASYQDLPEVFFAGDICKTDVGMATVEAAVQSGLSAAKALSEREPHPLGDPIILKQHEVYSDATLLAAKLALLPLAYWAKWWSIAQDTVPDLAKANKLSILLESGANMLELPLTYGVDWLESAYGLCKNLFFDRQGPTEGAGDPPFGTATEELRSSVADLAKILPGFSDLWAKAWSKITDGPENVLSSELPAGSPSTFINRLSSGYALAAKLIRTVRLAFESEETDNDFEDVGPKGYRRRWRVKQ